eukprot:8220683-Pyramimonas_sp.AAC.1
MGARSVRGIDEAWPVTRSAIFVVHREDDQARARSDASGSELDTEVALNIRGAEMEQFMKREAHGKVKEGVCWAVASKAPGGTRWIGIHKSDEAILSTEP